MAPAITPEPNTHFHSALEWVTAWKGYITVLDEPYSWILMRLPFLAVQVVMSLTGKKVAGSLNSRASWSAPKQHVPHPRVLKCCTVCFWITLVQGTGNRTSSPVCEHGMACAMPARGEASSLCIKAVESTQDLNFTTPTFGWGRLPLPILI